MVSLTFYPTILEVDDRGLPQKDSSLPKASYEVP